MYIKHKYLGITDEDSKDGEFVYTITAENGYYQTRIGGLWKALNARVGKGAYANVCVDFKDFKEFAESVTLLANYKTLDSYGNHYHLDKDLKCYKKDKSYSKDSVMFIPGHLNTALKGVIPYLECGATCGVSFSKSRNKFRAYCNDGSSRQIHLGYYGSKEAAQKAWVLEKINQIKRSLIKENISDEDILYFTGVLINDLEGGY